jgi:hypothetical protein
LLQKNVRFLGGQKMKGMLKLKLSRFLLAIAVLTLGSAWVARAQHIADPNGTQGYPKWWSDYYYTWGYTCDPGTIRTEILMTDLQGGEPISIRQFDANMLVNWDGGPNPPPESGGTWGYELLQAIKDQNDLVDAGEIEYVPATEFERSFLRMRVNAVTGKRIAFRGISTTNWPLPSIPSMPPLSALSAPWPPAPQQLPFTWEQYNYDYVPRWDPCQPPGPVALEGTHFGAIWPDWGTPLQWSLGMILDDSNEPNLPTSLRASCGVSHGLMPPLMPPFDDISLGKLFGQWVQYPGDYPADLNADGTVNFVDFALFGAHWSEEICP